MASILERFGALFRRVGKYDAQMLPYELGLRALTPAAANISEKSAMGLSAVYACVYRIATTIGTMDTGIYVRTDAGTEEATEHPAHALVSRRPNDYMTAPEFWETLVAYAVATGNGYAMIDRDSRGYGVALHVIDPDDVEPFSTDMGHAFKVRGVGVVQSENMFCLHNLQRKSPIRLHRENLGLAAAAQAYGANWYADGQMTGILSTDQPLRNEQMDAVRKSWQDQGTASTRLVPHGLKYHRITITPDEAMFIQTRKFQAEEIARIFGVPPALIQLESQTTYNNVEQQNIQYSRHTIAPWAKKIEREIDAKLLQERERPAHYSRLDLSGLHRGDLAARREYYESMVRLGVMSINEVRQKEDMNPVSSGDTRFVQVNQISLDSFGAYSDKLASDAAPAPNAESSVE
jgi:HK97 family phage portal protein